MALDTNTDSGRISRRTIIKGAAWSAPVMIAAVALPAAAASTNAITSISKTNPTGSLSQQSTVSVSLSVAPATYSGTLYLGLAAGSLQHPFTFANGGTSATVTVVNGVVTPAVSIVTPNGANKTATLSASTLSTLAGARTLTLST